jgi:hypothetical protein
LLLTLKALRWRDIYIRRAGTKAQFEKLLPKINTNADQRTVKPLTAAKLLINCRALDPSAPLTQNPLLYVRLNE